MLSILAHLDLELFPINVREHFSMEDWKKKSTWNKNQRKRMPLKCSILVSIDHLGVKNMKIIKLSVDFEMMEENHYVHVKRNKEPL